MELKNVFKIDGDDDEKIIELRYKSSKLVFVVVSLIFFMSFFLYGAGFYPKFFLNSASVFYVLLAISLVFYLYFFLRYTLKSKISGVIRYVLMLILLVLLVVFLIPVLVEGQMLSVI